jgi:hypothetical protein
MILKTQVPSAKSIFVTGVPKVLGDLPYSVGQYQTDLDNRHPNWRGNTAAEVKDLFNSY